MSFNQVCRNELMSLKSLLLVGLPRRPRSAVNPGLFFSTLVSMVCVPAEDCGWEVTRVLGDGELGTCGLQMTHLRIWPIL